MAPPRRRFALTRPSRDPRHGAGRRAGPARRSRRRRVVRTARRGRPAWPRQDRSPPRPRRMHRRPSCPGRRRRSQRHGRSRPRCRRWRDDRLRRRSRHRWRRRTARAPRPRHRLGRGGRSLRPTARRSAVRHRERARLPAPPREAARVPELRRRAPDRRRGAASARPPTPRPPTVAEPTTGSPPRTRTRHPDPPGRPHREGEPRWRRRPSRTPPCRGSTRGAAGRSDRRNPVTRRSTRWSPPARGHPPSHRRGRAPGRPTATRRSPRRRGVPSPPP
ncbi:hypothetical protein GALL_553040 [mine drainage metagenome]|uniref:Uncharacterized protein n=1 Tax=mine drainage metagenome TaxID=410659 RepID=A0A1J5P6U3_9ZZZZ